MKAASSFVELVESIWFVDMIITPSDGFSISRYTEKHVWLKVLSEDSSDSFYKLLSTWELKRKTPCGYNLCAVAVWLCKDVCSGKGTEDSILDLFKSTDHEMTKI